MVLVPGRKRYQKATMMHAPPRGGPFRIVVVESWKETIRHALRSGHIANNVEARSCKIKQDQVRSSKIKQYQAISSNIKQYQAISIVSVIGFCCKFDPRLLEVQNASPCLLY